MITIHLTSRYLYHKQSKNAAVEVEVEAYVQWNRNELRTGNGQWMMNVVNITGGDAKTRIVL